MFVLVSCDDCGGGHSKLLLCVLLNILVTSPNAPIVIAATLVPLCTNWYLLWQGMCPLASDVTEHLVFTVWVVSDILPVPAIHCESVDIEVLLS